MRGTLFSKLKEILPNTLLYLSVALVLYLVIIPIVFLLLSGFKPEGLVTNAGFTFSNYIELYSSARTYGLILNSLIFATGSTFVALFFSTLLAWIIERTNFPSKTWFRALIIAPMGVSPMLVAIGWVLLASPKVGFFNIFLMNVFNLSEAPLNIYSLPGMIFVQGITAVPSAFMLLCFIFRNMDPVFEDASAVSGKGVFTTLVRIVLPILKPGLLGVSILIFMVCLSMFDIPGIIGMPAGIKVLSLELFLAIQQPEGIPEFGIASSLATFFFISILILSYIYNRQTGTLAKFSTITGREFQPKILNLGAWKYVAVTFVICYLLLATGFPLVVLFWQTLTPYFAPFSFDMLHSLSLQNYRDLFVYPRLVLAIKNTIIVAVVSATALVFLSTTVSWVIVRSRYRWRRILDIISVLPMAMPHIMLGLALIYVYLTIKGGIYGSIWIIIIAFVTAYLTYATRLLNSTMFQIDKELEEAAQVSGASLPKIFQTIIIPLIAPSMIGLWIWVFVHSMRELSIALMLQSPKSLVLTTIAWHMWEKGEVAQVSIIGIGMTLFLFLVMGVGQILAQRFGFATGMR